MSFEYPRHICFKCERCVICCGDTKSRSRVILLMKTEVDRISRNTMKHIDEFAEEIENHEPYYYRMRKTADGKCIFLQRDACTIYQERPLICRFYPFELKDTGNNRYVFSHTNECPYIGKGPNLGKRYFQKLFAESTNLMKENAGSN